VAPTKRKANLGIERGRIFIPFLVGTTAVAASARRIERFGHDVGIMTIGVVAVGSIAFVVGAARELRGASARETGFKFAWTLICAAAFTLAGMLGWARFDLHGPSLATFLIYALGWSVCFLLVLVVWVARSLRRS